MKRMMAMERPLLNAHARAALEDALEALAQETIETGNEASRRIRRVVRRAPVQQREQFQQFYARMLQQVREDYGLEQGEYLQPTQQEKLLSLRAYAVEHQLHKALSRKALRRIHAMLMRHPELHEALHHIRDAFQGQDAHEQKQLLGSQKTHHDHDRTR